MPLKTTLRFDFDAAYTKDLDLDIAESSLDYTRLFELTTGTAASQADVLWYDTRTISASSNEDIDLAGTLSDAFGDTATFVDLKFLWIKAASGNTNNITVSRPATNGAPIFDSASDSTTLTPDGFFCRGNTVNGDAITAGTGDLINIANAGAGTSVTYDIIIIGTSA